MPLHATSQITLRTPSFRRNPDVTTLPQLEGYMVAESVERIDLYHNQDGTGQVGIAFDNGCSVIFDVDSWASLTAWNAKMMQMADYSAKEVHIHYGRP